MELSQKKDVIMDFVEEQPKSRLSLDSSRISKKQADKPIPRKIQRPKKNSFSRRSALLMIRTKRKVRKVSKEIPLPIVRGPRI